MYEKILLVDDEKSILEIVKYNLEKEGYRVFTAEDGYGAMEQFRKEAPDLLILDVMMPGMDGYEVCRRIRETSNVPIIMVTARTEEIDTVLGLEMGADEYVTKPFSMRELMARVRTALRRYSALTRKSQDAEDQFTAGDFVLDAVKFSCTKNGVRIDLTQRETQIIKLLMSRRGQVFPRPEILEKVWGYESLGDERTVDVTIRRLREKIEDDPSQPKLILTKRGVGYYFTEDR
ncbi:MAG: response regulator transcription factor [Firmicutes bacterium]|nr:response regulator transcription factor [Bacillota bacterium]